MKTLLSMLLTVTTIVTLTSSWSFADDTLEAKKQEYSVFLKGLGFEDYVGEIRANRKAKTGVGAISDSVLEFNQERYEIFNSSRTLAVEIISALYEGDVNISKKINTLVDFTARMLSLQPLDPPSEFPQRVLNVPASEKEKSRVKYVAEVTKQNMLDQTTRVMSDVIETLYGHKKVQEFIKAMDSKTDLNEKQTAALKRLTKIEKLVGQMIRFSYLDSEMGQTRFLGRALAASLLKYGIDEKNPDIKEKLEASVKREGLNLANFVGDTLVVDGRDGRKKIEIRNGDFLMERSMGSEAGEITWGARPSAENYLNAMGKGMLGHFWDRALPTEDVESYSLAQSLKTKLAEADIATNGFSHVGMAYVPEDSKTGIKMAWAVDNYPNAAAGGIRISGITEQFALRGPYMRLGVTRYNPYKFYDFAQKQIAQNGYRTDVWIGEKEVINKDGETVPNKNPEPAPWKIGISEEEFKTLHQVPRSQAPEWYAKVMKLTTHQLIHGMLTRDGVGFAYGFSNYLGRGYCTFTVNLATLQAAGLDLQPYPDQWNKVVKLLNKMGSESTKGLNLNLRILAPAGFAWQKELVDSVVDVTFPPLTARQRLRVTTQPFYIEKNTETTALLKTLSDFNKAVLKNNGAVTTDSEGLAEVEEAIRGEIQKREKAGRTQRRAGSQLGAGYLTSGCAYLLENMSGRKR